MSAARKLGRRAVLCGASSAVAVAALAMPALAVSPAAGDAVLLDLETQWLAARQASDEADRAFQVIKATLPEGAFGQPPFPKGDPLFVAVRCNTVPNDDGMTGRDVVTLEAIRQFNNSTEFCASYWRDMSPGHPDREGLRKSWLQRRAEGRQRVRWWHTKRAEQEALLTTSGARQAS